MKQKQVGGPHIPAIILLEGLGIPFQGSSFCLESGVCFRVKSFPNFFFIFFFYLCFLDIVISQVLLDFLVFFCRTQEFLYYLEQFMATLPSKKASHKTSQTLKILKERDGVGQAQFETERHLQSQRSQQTYLIVSQRDKFRKHIVNFFFNYFNSSIF